MRRHLEARGQGAEKLDPDAQSDEGGHGAVRDGWGEADVDLAVAVIDLDEIVLGHVELLQCEWMLGIVDSSDEVENFKRINLLGHLLIIVRLRVWPLVQHLLHRVHRWVGIDKLTLHLLWCVLFVDYKIIF